MRNISREAAAAPSRPRMATSRRRPLFLFLFGPPTRPTTQTPHNTQQPRGGARSRYSGPNESRSADGQTPGTGTLRMGFAQLTTSRSRLARTRHHRKVVHVTPESCGVTEFGCPGPTPSDAASPVCPSRHHAAGYGQFPPRFAESATRLSSHHDVLITPPHYYILHRTHRPSRRV